MISKFKTPLTGHLWFAIKEDWHSKCPQSGEVNEYRNFLKHGDWDIVIFHAYLYSFYVCVDILEKFPAKKILVSHGFAALQWIKNKSFPCGLAT